MRVVIDDDAEEKAKQAVVPWMADTLGPEISTRAKRYCPVDTGSLRDSIEDHMDDTTLVVSATGSDERTYAAYIELGHRVYHPSTGKVGPEWVPSQPFLRPALYGGSAHLRAKGFREDKRMQYRVAEARAEERRRATRERAERFREDQARVTPEQHAKWAEREQRRSDERARQATEDWGAYSVGPDGERHYYREGQWDRGLTEEQRFEGGFKARTKGRNEAREGMRKWLGDAEAERRYPELTREEYRGQLEAQKRREAIWLAEQGERGPHNRGDIPF